LSKNDKQKQTFKITGMDCPNCALKVEKDIARQAGVESARVDFFGNVLTVVGEGLEFDHIQRRVRLLGYNARPIDQSGPKRTSLLIPDMDCADEERIIRKALESIETVSRLEFDLIGRRVVVEHNSTASSLLEAIRREGFEAKALDPGRLGLESPVSRLTIWGVGVSAVLVALGAVADIWNANALLIKGLVLAGVAVGGWKIGKKGALAALRLRLDMNFLMSAAVLGAMVIGQWVEAGTVIVLFALAQLLESFSLDRSRRAIKSLIDLSPQTANVIRQGQDIEVPVEEVRHGDIVVARPGEKIPVDGKIISGNSSVNRAAITGESLPVDVSPGDTVFAGTINGEGAIEIEAIHVAGDTTLDRIIELVEKARAAKAPTQGFVERFSRVYTPVVVGVAVLMAIIPPLLFGAVAVDWIYRSLTLLVIACPCALVISTPVTIVSALTAAAHNGVLIKGGVYLENLHRIKSVAFDKTGTITKGIPVVKTIIPVNELNKDRILELTASIEKRSEHPIASAIIRRAIESGREIIPAADCQAIPGKGASGLIFGKKYYVGNLQLFEQMGVVDARIQARLEEIENASQTAILLGTSEEVLGIIAIADEIRTASPGAVAELRNLGIDRIVMLTGDNRRTSEAVGRAVGIEDIRSELLPDGKVGAIEDIKREFGTVVMVGDGINDAPALAASDIGFAMGAAGSDIALETADIALILDEPSKIPWTFRLSKKAYGIIIENISMAIGIKAVFVALTFMGAATLWMAVFADMGISLLVILNGMRALRTG